MESTSPRRVVATSGPTATLEEVDILRELDARPARSPDYETQNRALAALAEEMAVNPRNMLQRLVEVAVDLCQADTSGISLLEGGVFDGRPWLVCSLPRGTERCPATPVHVGSSSTATPFS
jgi:hypothetical protein